MSPAALFTLKTLVDAADEGMIVEPGFVGMLSDGSTCWVAAILDRTAVCHFHGSPEARFVVRLTELRAEPEAIKYVRAPDTRRIGISRRRGGTNATNPAKKRAKVVVV